MNNCKFNKEFLSRLGIDSLKSEIIQFIVANENLNNFAETENFYYWFHKEERVLKDYFGFMKHIENDQDFNVKINDKEFNINSFDGIASLVVEVKKADKIAELFNGNFNFGRTEYFLRYSKAYKKLYYYCNVSSLNVVRKRNLCLVKHKKNKFFSINEKNYVLIYVNNSIPRYISNKNAAFIKPFLPYNFHSSITKNNYQDYEQYLQNVNRLLLSIHQKSKIYTQNNFNNTIFCLKNIPNKLMLNVNSFDELLSRITKNRPVAKILLDKFQKSELVYLFDLVEYDEVDKIIKFIYDTIDIYDENERQKSNQPMLPKPFLKPIVFSNRIYEILFDYLSFKFGFIIPDHKNKKFDIIERTSGNILHDYIRMCELQREKVNLKIKSFKRLHQEHDRLSVSISVNQIPEIKPNKKYPIIKSTFNFEIEKIIDKKRLVLESKIQKHCVKTYYANINKGFCCIYSFLDLRDNQRYTLEIQRKFTSSGEIVFILNQIRGKFNKMPIKDIMDEVNAIINKYNIYSDLIMAKNKFGILYNSKNKKNEIHDILPF